jgi:hypothetical protein
MQIEFSNRLLVKPDNIYWLNAARPRWGGSMASNAYTIPAHLRYLSLSGSFGSSLVSFLFRLTTHQRVSQAIPHSIYPFSSYQRTP